ncbi:phage tail tip fiber protein [Pseudomonas rubra]
MNGINGTLSSPFVIQGGQVFINHPHRHGAFRPAHTG